MPIEESLGRIATALETIAAGAATVVNNAPEEPAKRRRTRKPAAEAAPAPEAPPDPPSSDTPAVTRESVREALRIFRKDHTKDEAREVLGKFKVKSITAADDDILPALLKAFAA